MIVFDSPPREPDEKEIFIDDIDKLVLRCYPNHEGQHPIFEKFGFRTGGLCDNWQRTKDWKQLPEIEKWKYVALCSLYWENMYEYWLDKERYEVYKNHLRESAKKKPEFKITLKELEAKETRNLLNGTKKSNINN